MRLLKRKKRFQSVAKRLLSVDGSRSKVSVEIGKPYPRDVDYACEFKIRYGRKAIRKEIYGVDAFQSLELALKIIPTFLRTESCLPQGKMFAFDPGDDMGFPEFYK